VPQREVGTSRPLAFDVGRVVLVIAHRIADVSSI
jgi:hypothetical protein